MRWTALIAGLMVIVTTTAQEKGVRFNDSDMALDLSEAFTYHKYPTYDQYLQMMQTYAQHYPEICRLDTFGTSQEGRQLLALKISDNPDLDEAEAGFFYSSTMHGNELVGYVLLLRLADTLLSAYGKDSEITHVVDELAIWINPLSNPDGSYSGDNNLSLKNSIRYPDNIDRIDLNRDFPDPDRKEPDDTTGRAKETRHMMQFLKEHAFALSANIHGGAEVVNFPWDYDSAFHADDEWYRFISREYADEARAVDPLYMNDWQDGITHGAYWYVANGTRQDYVNYYLEGREVTLELSNDRRLGSDYLEEFWAKNHRSLLNYITQCTYGIRGRVTNRATGDPVRACISIPGHDSFYSVVHSSADLGDYYRLIKEGVYDLVITAPGFITDTITAVPVTDHSAIVLDIELEPDPYSGMQSGQPSPSFQIYPNPARDFLFIQPEHVATGPMEIKVYSVRGQPFIHLSLEYTGHPIALPLGSLSSGLCFLQIISDEFTSTQSFIKQ